MTGEGGTWHARTEVTTHVASDRWVAHDHSPRVAFNVGACER
jgi:hypothetical protein